MLNVFQPKLGAAELEAIQKVFESNWIGKGKITDLFEASFANYIRVDKQHIRSISTCTEGLFQSMKLLNIGPGDEVILPTISFVGAGNAIVDAGAIPVFCDVNPRTLNVTAEFIARRATKKTKAIVLIHYGGFPCDMDRILKLGIPVIEDNACGVASTYKGRACGTLGDIGIWSFDSMKVLVTGDGGMVYCKDKALADKLEKQIYLGMTSGSGASKSVAVDAKWWEFEVECAGRRAIINDATAAMGIVQLKELDSFIDWRRRIHKLYNEMLKDTEVTRPPPMLSECTSTYYFYWIQHEKRDELASFLGEKDIYTTFRYYPLHKVEFYGSSNISLPRAEWAANNTLCLPMHHSLSYGDVKHVCDSIKEFFDGL